MTTDKQQQLAALTLDELRQRLAGAIEAIGHFGDDPLNARSEGIRVMKAMIAEREAEAADAHAGEVLDPEPEVGQALAVHPGTGEAIDLRGATMEQLARAAGEAVDFSSRFSEFQGALSSELVERLDRSGSWTHRLGDPESGIQYEVTSSSPEVGTVEYEPVMLDVALQTLMATDPPVIDPQGAAGALKRQITLTLQVPFGADLEGLAAEIELGKLIIGRPVPGPLDDRLKDDLVAVDVVDVPVVSAKPSRSPVAAGIKRLSKLPAAAQAIASAKKPPPAVPPARKAKVKTIIAQSKRPS